LSTFAGDRWRKSSEGIFTQVWASGDYPQSEAGFKIRLAVHPSIADDALRALLPIVVRAECPFKLIANTALLELACSKWSSEEPAGDFMTVYPPSQMLFNDLTAKLQHAIRGIKSSPIPPPPAESVARAALTADDPWPGRECYLPDEGPYFFGREDEQVELAQRLERATLTVVLGQAGAGKSSLLRAGLRSSFDRMSFEPVCLRLQLSGAVHPVQQVRDEINRVLAERQIDGAPFGEGQTLREYFRQQQPGWVAADRKPVVPVLIFDQFEDVLSFDATDPATRNQVEALWTQIANLVENRGRETGRQLHLPSPDFRTERNLFKVVISLRQDNLPQLLARRGQLPSIAQNHFVLKPFNGTRAVQAVLGPGRRVLDPASPEALAEEIVRCVGRECPQSSEGPIKAGGAVEPLDSLRIEPMLLSFFCWQLNEARKRSREPEPGASLITARLVQAEAERIFADFFQREPKAAEAPLATESQSSDQQAPPPPEENELPVQESEPPVALPVTEPQIPDHQAPEPPQEQKFPEQYSEPSLPPLITPPPNTDQEAPQAQEEEKLPDRESQPPVVTVAVTAPQTADEQVPPPSDEQKPPEQKSEPPVVVPVTEPETTAPQVPEPPKKKELPRQVSEPPLRPPVPAPGGERAVKRLRYLVSTLSVLLIILLAVMVVTQFEELQRKQTEAELEEYISHLATAKKTFKSAQNEIARAESNLALKESNLLVLTEQARQQMLESRAAKEQYTKLAGEQTNIQSRMAELNAEKTKAESRLAQWSSLANDLTNQITTLTRQKEELEARNRALTATNISHPATNAAPVWNLSLNRPATPNVADEKQAAAMSSPPEKLLAPLTPDTTASAQRYADVILTHGQCLYSEPGTEFHPLQVRQVVHQGAVIKTGKTSWCDFFVRRAGITVRLAPESAVKITKLSLATQNGVPVMDTLLELPYGRIFTVVRALVPGSTVEISDGAGRSVIEGGGLGSYMITAPRPEFGEKLTVTPLRIITQNGTSVITPNTEYSAKDGAAFSLGASTWEANLIHLDELEAEADRAIAEPEPPKSPKGN
jgi:hypothetical protein